MQIVCEAVKKVIHFPAVDSTNNQAKRIGPTVSDEQLPMLITCGRQKAGRGRNQNTWLSNKGSITISLLCRPTPPDGLSSENSVSQWLSLWSAVCVHQTISEFLPDFSPDLKWPNDILVEGRKNSGILIESILGSPGRYVIGIGINVNNDLETLQDTKTRFSWSESGNVFSVQDVIDRLVGRLVEWDYFSQKSQERILQYWGQHDFFKGNEIELIVPDPNDSAGRVLQGIYRGLSQDGFLQIEVDQQVLVIPTCHHIRKV